MIKKYIIIWQIVTSSPIVRAFTTNKDFVHGGKLGSAITSAGSSSFKRFGPGDFVNTRKFCYLKKYTKVVCAWKTAIRNKYCIYEYISVEVSSKNLCWCLSEKIHAQLS